MIIMGLTQEYREQIEEVEHSMESHFSSENALSLKKSLDDVLPFIFMLLAFIVLFGFVVPVNQRVEIWINRANYVVLAYFGARLVVEYKLSNPGDHFLRQHWLDFLMVIPAFSILQEVRLLGVLQETRLAAYAPEFATGSAYLRGTTTATKMTKISRVIKRSLSF